MTKEEEIEEVKENEEEIWKIDEYYPYYRISNFGRIEIIKTRKKNKFIKQNVERFKKTNSYIKIRLYNKNQGDKPKKGSENRDNQYTHRLVANLFVYNPDPINKTTVNHIDGNKYNNKWTNLEWSSSKEQGEHSAKLKLKGSTSKGRSVKIYKDGEEYKIYKSISEAYRDINPILDVQISNGQFTKLFSQNKSFVTENEEEITGEYNDMEIKNKKEIWKQVSINGNNEDYENFYVSNLGRIKFVNHNDHDIIRNIANKRGYMIVNIHNSYTNKSEEKYVHRLTAEAFCEIPVHLAAFEIEDLEVDHIDSNPLNNKASNLRWCTTLENAQNEKTKKKHGKIIYQYKKEIYEDDEEIYTLIKKFDTITEARKELKVDHTSISKILDNPNRRCGGFHWTTALIEDAVNEIKINENLKNISTNNEFELKIKKEKKLNKIVICKFSYKGTELI